MTKPIRILLIEDNDERVVRIESLLNAVGKDASEVDRAGTFDDAMESISTGAYDVCLANLRTGAGDGLAFVRKAVDHRCHTPIILIAAAEDLKVDISAMAAGAADFLIYEELTAPVLVRSIRHVLARDRYIGEARDQWKVEGSHEDLTELCKAAHEFADTTSHRFRTPLAVIKAFAKILADGVAGDLNESQKEYLETIQLRVDDLNVMINEMFEMSSLEAGVIGAARSQKQLPRKSSGPAPTPKTGAVNAGKPRPSNTPGSSSRKTVLIADDDELIIQALSTIIEGLGLNVVAATDGRDALTKFASHTCDLLILDIKMPGFDGLTVYEKILDLQFSEFILTPAILLTGKSDHASIERCAELHAHYVLKDADAWDKLTALIREILNIPEQPGVAAE